MLPLSGLHFHFSAVVMKPWLISCDQLSKETIKVLTVNCKQLMTFLHLHLLFFLVVESRGTQCAHTFSSSGLHGLLHGLLHDTNLFHAVIYQMSRVCPPWTSRRHIVPLPAYSLLQITLCWLPCPHSGFHCWRPQPLEDSTVARFCFATDCL